MFELQRPVVDLAEVGFEDLLSSVGKPTEDLRVLECVLELRLLRAVAACGHLAAHLHHLVVSEVLEVQAVGIPS